jgi:hypothetical protein
MFFFFSNTVGLIGTIHASLLTLRLNINDKTRLIGGANDPPVCQDQSRERDSSGAE